ncbi:TrkA family potassium uptake protein [Aquiluna sp.]|nr:TrkA family potassium uptake protein [Aquiluna sp.]MDA7806937.1 TrkA family potassium uptake protein [Aquiluna sp.]MDA8901921.1 TrkA family potassium uptake protein [Aquiluna sp.]MDA8992695.1 TrkA family potassium uptake protein [Aquiluna sp.]MDG1818156.1 TrkA family potassium uptake protein [Aquiluna sp.]
MAKDKAKRRVLHTNVIVIGMGRFGSSLARELMRTGHEVLGVDTDERLVQQMSHELTHTVKADTTDEAVLSELGIGEFDAAVVAIGADIEASILTTSLLLQLGVPNVWAKANSQSHGRILEQLGAHHVVFPEYEMGKRVAHMVSGESLDYVPIDNDFVMVKALVPESFNDQTLADLKIRSNYGVTVVAITKGDGEYKPAFPDTVLHAGDQIIVAGQVEPLDKFCQVI